MRVGVEVIEQALGTGSAQVPECSPEMTWTRMEFSVMLEHVQAHVAPTDVDPGAGLQWLPKIRRNSPKVKRTGALLERVFMPCDMFLRYTRHKGGNPDLKVTPFLIVKISLYCLNFRFRIFSEPNSCYLAGETTKRTHFQFTQYNRYDDFSAIPGYAGCSD